MTEHVSASDLRADMSHNLNRVAYGHERLVLHRRGRDVAAVISLDDLHVLERLDEILAEGKGSVSYKRLRSLLEQT